MSRGAALINRMAIGNHVRHACIVASETSSVASLIGGALSGMREGASAAPS